jgi:orotidine-5'-phosphate decarboxylase
MALDRLVEKIIATGNPTVMGLDPRLEYVPAYIKEEALEVYGNTLEGASEALFSFNKTLIDAVSDIIPAVKPQAAFYEMYGWQGLRCLARTISYANEKGMYVIVDAKRGDIGSTMEAYASAWLGVVEVESEVYVPFGADAMTVNAYLGSDAIEPLIKVCKAGDKAIFVLAKTSNPSSAELQDATIGDKTVFELIAANCALWGLKLPGKYGYSGIGIVVGATYPEQLVRLRQSFPGLFFLVPGYGAQGGGGKEVEGAFDKDGLGAIVNASRSLMLAWRDAPTMSLTEAVRAEALRMKADITARDR